MAAYEEFRGYGERVDSVGEIDGDISRVVGAILGAS